MVPGRCRPRARDGNGTAAGPLAKRRALRKLPELLERAEAAMQANGIEGVAIEREETRAALEEAYKVLPPADGIVEAHDAVQVLQNTGSAYKPAVTYPSGNPLNAAFQLVARFIIRSSAEPRAPIISGVVSARAVNCSPPAATTAWSDCGMLSRVRCCAS